MSLEYILRILCNTLLCQSISSVSHGQNLAFACLTDVLLPQFCARTSHTYFVHKINYAFTQTYQEGCFKLVIPILVRFLSFNSRQYLGDTSWNNAFIFFWSKHGVCLARTSLRCRTGHVSYNLFWKEHCACLVRSSLSWTTEHINNSLNHPSTSNAHLLIEKISSVMNHKKLAEVYTIRIQSLRFEFLQPQWLWCAWADWFGKLRPQSDWKTSGMP